MTIDIIHHPETVKIPVGYLDKKIAFHEYLSQTCPSLFGPNANYKPTPYLTSGHLQTMFAAFYKGDSTIDDITFKRQMLNLENGGVVSLDWVIPFDTLPENTPTVVILHGLTGGSHESYIRGLLQIICRSPINYRAVVFNARGCGFTNIETPQLFNASNTDDIREAINFIQKQLGENTPLIGIGYSLGSNILVKYLGEEQEKTPLIAAISVANPYDLITSGAFLDKRYWTRKIYSQTMANNLKKVFLRNKDIILNSDKEINLSQVLSAKTIREYDNAYTIKMFNYTTVDNYYRDSSCSRLIEYVRIPLLCISALDDPISTLTCIPFDEIKVNPYVILAATKYGGHIGWFEHLHRPSRWVDKPITEFMVAMFQAADRRQDVKRLDTHVAIRSAKSIRKLNPWLIQLILDRLDASSLNPWMLFLALCLSYLAYK